MRIAFELHKWQLSLDFGRKVVPPVQPRVADSEPTKDEASYVSTGHVSHPSSFGFYPYSE